MKNPSGRDALRRPARAVAALAALAIALVLVACSSSTESSEPSATTSTGAPAATIKDGGVLKAAVGDPDSLDPATSALFASSEIYNSIFDTLVDIDENGEVYGVLAKDWETPDDKTWVFNLQEGVKFHNGDPFTAEDVKYTMDRILDPKTASSYAAQFSAVKDVEVKSPTQVVFHLKRPFAPLLSNLASNGQIVNKRAIEEGKPDREPVGTGPFKLKEWVNRDHITLEKNADYFRKGLPHLDGIRYTFPEVSQGRIDALRSGELDWVNAIPPQSVAAVSEDPAFNHVTSAITGLPDVLILNTSKPPLNNKALRQAINLAVDKKQLLDAAYLGSGQQGSEEVAPDSVWYGGTDPYKDGPDIEAAKAKMKEAGLENGIDIEFMAWTTRPEPTRVGEVLKEQLKQIGINLKVVPLDISTWFNRLSKLDYEMTVGFQERVIEPDGFYNVWLAADSGANFQGYKNPKLDAAIRKAEATMDDEERKQAYADAREIVFEESPVVFVHHTPFDYLMRKEVVGSTINPTQKHRMELVGFSR